MGTRIYMARYRRPKTKVHVEFTGVLKVLHGFVMGMVMLAKVIVAICIPIMVLFGVIVWAVASFTGEQGGEKNAR